MEDMEDISSAWLGKIDERDAAAAVAIAVEAAWSDVFFLTFLFFDVVFVVGMIERISILFCREKTMMNVF